MLLFALIGLMLAAVGIYGVVSQSVAQRTLEIGIRIALGAQRSEVVRMMLNNTWWLVAIGLVAVPVALLSGSSLWVLLFDVTPYNAVTTGVVCLAMIVIATTAAYIPACRASRVDAMVALRAD